MSTFTYDVTDNTGLVRLNIADIDLDVTTGDRSRWTVLFTDEEIGVFLTRASNDINLASAYALHSIAASRALLAKRRTLGDYQEDLTQLSKEIRAQAKEYERMAQETPAADWAEMATTDFAARDIIYNHSLREG